MTIEEIMRAYRGDLERSNPPDPTFMEQVNKSLDSYLAAIGAPVVSKYHGVNELGKMVPRDKEQLLPGGTIPDEQEVLSQLTGGLDPAPRFGAGLIRAGEIKTPDILRDLMNRHRGREVNMGIMHEYGSPTRFQIHGADVDEIPAVWGRAAQTFQPSSTPQDIRVYRYDKLGDIPPGVQESSGHFRSQAHARKVGVEKPVDFWEEIQSEFKHDKPPTPQMLRPTDEMEGVNIAGLPSDVASPWAPGDTVGVRSRIRTPQEADWDYVISEGMQEGYRRTVSRANESQLRSEVVQLTPENKARLDGMPPWVRLLIKSTSDVWRRGGDITPAEHEMITRGLMEGFDNDTMPPYYKNVLAAYVRTMSTTHFNFQPTGGDAAARQAATTLSGRANQFIQDLDGIYQKIIADAAGAAAPAESLIKSYPQYGRENIAEAIIQRLMAEADKSGRVFTMTDLGGAQMRKGAALSYGYKEAPRRLGLVPEMLEMTTPYGAGASHSYGAAELQRLLSQPISDMNLSKLGHILNQGGNVTSVPVPGSLSKKQYTYQVPILTRPQDIESAKKMGIWSPSQVRTNLLEELQRYESWRKETEPMQLSQILDRILRSDNPLNEASQYGFDLRDLGRQLGGVAVDISPEDLAQARRYLRDEGINLAGGLQIPNEEMLELLRRHDPLYILEMLHR